MYKALGFFFLALAFLGAFLPLLPTVPFLIVAAACFARSSKEWHQWLLDNKIFGPSIRGWEEERCMHCKSKGIALGVMAVGGIYSVFFAIDQIYLQASSAVLILTGIIVVARVKVCAK